MKSTTLACALIGFLTFGVPGPEEGAHRPEADRSSQAQVSSQRLRSMRDEATIMRRVLVKLLESRKDFVLGPNRGQEEGGNATRPSSRPSSRPTSRSAKDAEVPVLRDLPTVGMLFDRTKRKHLVTSDRVTTVLPGYGAAVTLSMGVPVHELETGDRKGDLWGESKQEIDQGNADRRLRRATMDMGVVERARLVILEGLVRYAARLESFDPKDQLAVTVELRPLSRQARVAGVDTMVIQAPVILLKQFAERGVDARELANNAALRPTIF